MIGPLAYIGGKNRLASKIIELFPEHLTYVEPFCGGAQVFFRKAPSKVEVLNDLNEDIFNFLRVCQLHYEELVRYLRYAIVSRRLFDLFEKTAPETLTDIQRAVRFFYLQKNCYGGLVRRRNFCASVQDGSNYNPEKIPELISKVHERLLHTQLECLPYEDIFKKYDRASTFFYLDPPYFNKPYYRFNFVEEDYVRMAEILKSIKGKFLLSLNDMPEIRRIFSSFNIRTIDLVYTARKNAGKKYTELLIANYPITPASNPKNTRVRREYQSRQSVGPSSPATEARHPVPAPA
jgi:DNA adenine methylase